MLKKAIISILVILLIIAVVILTNFAPKSNSFNSSYKTVSIYANYLFSLPSGTNALELNYTNFLINSNNYGNISPVNVVSKGVLIFSNQNTSTLITSVYIPNNATISSISMNITNETIEINNTKYTVGILNKTIYSKTINSGNISENQNVILVISGSIIPLFLQNKINFFSYESATSYGNYSTYKEDFPKALSTLSLISYNLSTINNYTKISLTLKNKAQNIIQLKSIELSGKMALVNKYQNFNINLSDIKKLSNILNYTYLNSSISKISANITSPTLNTELSNFLNYLKPITSQISTTNAKNVLSGISGYINQNTTSYLISQLESINYSKISTKIGLNTSGNFSQITNNISSTISEIKTNYLSSLDNKEAELNYTTFIPLDNKTLILINSNESNLNSNTMILLPNETVTLNYYGEITFASNNIFIPITNNTYRLWLIGDNGIAYNYNISAS